MMPPSSPPGRAGLPPDEDYMKVIFRFASAAFGLGLLVGVAAGASPAAAQTQIKPAVGADDPVVATVDGAPILRSEIADFQKALPAQYRNLPIEMLYPALLDKLIEIKLIADAGQKAQIGNDEEV